MRTDDLLKETREDVKDIKETLINVDKNLSLAIVELSNQKELLQKHVVILAIHEKHVETAKTTIKIMAFFGALIITLLKVVPGIQALLR
jgi:hypothetical protein